MNYTKEEAYRCHKILWQGIVDELEDGSTWNIFDLKYDRLMKLLPDRSPDNYCFLCEHYDLCNECPMKGTNDKSNCYLYEDLLKAKSQKKRIKLAKSIRDIILK